jgi:hypothetical protein
MSKRLGFVAVVVLATLGLVLGASPVGAKILPYDLEVVGRGHKAGQPVTVVMYPHPQNVLPESFGFEVRWAKVRAQETVASVARRRGKPVMMHRFASGEYRGTIRPRTAGLYAVYGNMSDADAPGYPKPIRVRVKR